MNCVIFICGCHKYISNVRTALERWKSVIPAHMKVVAVVGEGESDRQEDIIQLDVPDTYEALPQKIHAALIYLIQQYPHAKGFFKTDDDIVFGSEIVQALDLYWQVPYWGVVMDKSSGGNVSRERIQSRCTNQAEMTFPAARYVWGLGYWLSRSSAQLVAKDADYPTIGLEDVCMGAKMNASGIFPVGVHIPYTEQPRYPR